MVKTDQKSSQQS